MIGVRPVNCDVTGRTRLILLRLVVERQYCGRCGIHRKGVAFQAQQVHLAALQQTRVRGAMGRMARHTSLRLDRGVLESKRPGFIRVAGEANGILGRRRP